MPAAVYLGGAYHPSNVQWQTTQAAEVKDKIELNKDAAAGIFAQHKEERR